MQESRKNENFYEMEINLKQRHFKNNLNLKIKISKLI